jgi:hypothetical protein
MAGSTRTLAFVVVAFAIARAHAQAPQPPSLSIELPAQPPAGFDRGRLQQRIAVYLGGIAVLVPSDDGRPARFHAQLDWPQGTMTPLRGQVLDRAFAPPRRHDFDVSTAESWEELERLVALKLSSVLRVAMAQNAPQAEPREPEARETEVEAPREAGATSAVVDLGGGVLVSDGLEAPRFVGGLRIAVLLQRWALGVAATLSSTSTAGAGGAGSDALESSWTASLRYDLLSSDASPWLLQIGGDLGLFVARIRARRAEQERATYAVSPLSSLTAVGGYRLLARPSVALLLGPTLDLLWNRSQISAGGTPVYDSGRVRTRVELKLMLAF